MPNLPTATVLAVLVLVSGIAGVVAADPTATPVATQPVTENATETEPGIGPETVPPESDDSFERRLTERLAQFDLTGGQIRAIVKEASRLRGDGASRLVVKSSIVLHLYEFGVDAPFLYADGGVDGTVGERIAERLGERYDLNDAQVEEIASTVDRMHADGATRVEIYRAIRALLVDYGVGEDELATLDRRVKHAFAHREHQRAHELHAKAHRLHHQVAHDGTDRDRDDAAVDQYVDRLADRHGLTDAQADELGRLVEHMIADGATREEIARAVRDRLADWGADTPPTDVPADGSGDTADG